MRSHIGGTAAPGVANRRGVFKAEGETRDVATTTVVDLVVASLRVFEVLIDGPVAVVVEAVAELAGKGTRPPTSGATGLCPGTGVGGLPIRRHGHAARAGEAKRAGSAAANPGRRHTLHRRLTHVVAHKAIRTIGVARASRATEVAIIECHASRVLTDAIRIA